MSECNGHSVGYRIEVRAAPSVINEPKKLASGFIATTEWRELPVDRSPRGTIRNNVYPALAQEVGLMSFDTALAVIAATDADIGWMSGLEFRLVKVKLHYRYHTEEVGIGEPIDLHKMERAATFRAREPKPEPDADPPRNVPSTEPA